MRILLVGSFNNGVFYHRLQVPYNALQSEGHDVLKTPSLHWEGGMVTVEELKQFDVIVFNRNISDILDPSPIFAKAKVAGVRIIMDLDDYWDIVPGHPMFSFARKTNFSKCIQDQLKYADHITTTHSHLRSQIIKLGIDKRKINHILKADSTKRMGCVMACFANRDCCCANNASLTDHGKNTDIST
jgi:hypothetical protein